MLRMLMCWVLLLLVSFATYSHELNGNSLVKKFAFKYGFLGGASMPLASILWNSRPCLPLPIREWRRH